MLGIATIDGAAVGLDGFVMTDPERISDAGNTLVPAILTLRSRGFRVRRDQDGDRESWSAETSDLRFVADDPLTLLGLVAMRDTRGRDWKASDEEIAATLLEFYAD